MFVNMSRKSLNVECITLLLIIPAVYTRCLKRGQL